MAEPFPAGDFVRIIYPRGIQLLGAEGGWIVPSSERLERVQHPAVFAAAHDLRHIICDTEFNVPFFQPRRMFDPTGRPVSRVRYLKGYVEESPRRIYKYMVEHYLYCAVAHLGYLAEAYAGLAVLDNRQRWSLPEHARANSTNQLHDSALRHGEAVFTSLVSALETSRFLLWRQNLKAPRTLPETFEALDRWETDEICDAVVPFEALWFRLGPTLVAYRDCAARFHPVTAHGGRCGTLLNEADVWETRIDLPDNPETTVPEALRFVEEIDLLDYCWTTTCDVVRCIEQVVPEIYTLAEANRPGPRWPWLGG